MSFGLQRQASSTRRSGWLMAAGVLMCLLLVLRSHYRLGLVDGRSMQPTYHGGDWLVVDKRAYKNADPQRGDVVLAWYHQQWIVKRIVGLPGEEVEVKGGTLYINDNPVTENYRSGPGFSDIAKGKLFEGKYATLGDNRSIPSGAGVHPIVTKEQILGKVIFSVRPPWARQAAPD